jgi:hypothetical protein
MGYTQSPHWVILYLSRGTPTRRLTYMEQKTLETFKAEIEQMNKLLLHLLEEGTVGNFIALVVDSLKEETESDPGNFLSSDGEDIRIYESDIDRHTENVWESRFPDFEVPTAVYEAVQEHFNGTTHIRDWEMEMKEVIEDEREYNKNPLRYVGMSEKDFL